MRAEEDEVEGEEGQPLGERVAALDALVHGVPGTARQRAGGGEEQQAGPQSSDKADSLAVLLTQALRRCGPLILIGFFDFEAFWKPETRHMGSYMHFSHCLRRGKGRERGAQRVLASFGSAVLAGSALEMLTNMHRCFALFVCPKQQFSSMRSRMSV